MVYCVQFLFNTGCTLYSVQCIYTAVHIVKSKVCCRLEVRYTQSCFLIGCGYSLLHPDSLLGWLCCCILIGNWWPKAVSWLAVGELWCFLIGYRFPLLPPDCLLVCFSASWLVCWCTVLYCTVVPVYWLLVSYAASWLAIGELFCLPIGDWCTLLCCLLAVGGQVAPWLAIGLLCCLLIGYWHIMLPPDWLLESGCWAHKRDAANSRGVRRHLWSSLPAAPQVQQTGEMISSLTNVVYMWPIGK